MVSLATMAGAIMREDFDQEVDVGVVTATLATIGVVVRVVSTRAMRVAMTRTPALFRSVSDHVCHHIIV